MVISPPVSEIDWPVSYRIIRTIYPPVWLFEDVAERAAWDLIASAEAKTNPRVRDQIGDLTLVPVERRVAGPSASLVMAAFTHVSRDRPGRFSDGRLWRRRRITSNGSWLAPTNRPPMRNIGSSKRISPVRCTICAAMGLTTAWIPMIGSLLSGWRLP